MEASGHARWFERLISELHFELWIGDAAEIRTKRVRKQKKFAVKPFRSSMRQPSLCKLSTIRIHKGAEHDDYRM
jgi:hypothetical protein